MRIALLFVMATALIAGAGHAQSFHALDYLVGGGLPSTGTIWTLPLICVLPLEMPLIETSSAKALDGIAVIRAKTAAIRIDQAGPQFPDLAPDDLFMPPAAIVFS